MSLALSRFADPFIADPFLTDFDSPLIRASRGQMNPINPQILSTLNKLPKYSNLT